MASPPSKETKIKSADPKPALAPAFKPHSRMQRTTLIRNIHTK